MIITKHTHRLKTDFPRKNLRKDFVRFFSRMRFRLEFTRLQSSFGSILATILFSALTIFHRKRLPRYGMHVLLFCALEPTRLPTSRLSCHFPTSSSLNLLLCLEMSETYRNYSFLFLRCPPELSIFPINTNNPFRGTVTVCLRTFCCNSHY